MKGPFVNRSRPSTITLETWRSADLSYGQRLLAVLGMMLMLLLMVFGGFFVITIFAVTLNTGKLDPDPSIWLSGVGALVALIVGGFGVRFLAPKLRLPPRFQPRYGMVPADILNYEFEVRFQPQRVRSLRGPGKVTFTNEGLLAEGRLDPHPLLQLAIVLGLCVLPVVLRFGLGVGVIPAILIARLVGRRRVAVTVPYGAIQTLTAAQRKVKLSNSDGVPRQLIFTAAGGDSDRMFRELQVHLPHYVS